MPSRKNMIREKEIENHLVREVKKLGGRAYKWVSPGNDGVPDRIVFLPGCAPELVELKSPSGVLRPQQELQIRWLEDSGYEVYVLSTKTAVDLWLGNMKLQRYDAEEYLEEPDHE